MRFELGCVGEGLKRVVRLREGVSVDRIALFHDRSDLCNQLRQCSRRKVDIRDVLLCSCALQADGYFPCVWSQVAQRDEQLHCGAVVHECLGSDTQTIGEPQSHGVGRRRLLDLNRYSAHDDELEQQALSVRMQSGGAVARGRSQRRVQAPKRSVESRGVALDQQQGR